MLALGPLGGETVAPDHVRGKVRATASCRDSPPLRSRERPAMPFLAKFQRNIENNVKFVAIFIKKIVKFVAFLYIKIVEFVAK